MAKGKQLKTKGLANTGKLIAARDDRQSNPEQRCPVFSFEYLQSNYCISKTAGILLEGTYPVKQNILLDIIHLQYIMPSVAKKKVTVWAYVCERCEHEWIPRNTENEPRVCPKCKSPYWNRPRRDAGKAEKSKG